MGPNVSLKKPSKKIVPITMNASQIFVFRHSASAVFRHETQLFNEFLFIGNYKY